MIPSPPRFPQPLAPNGERESHVPTRDRTDTDNDDAGHHTGRRLDEVRGYGVFGVVRLVVVLFGVCFRSTKLAISAVTLAFSDVA